MRDLHTTEATEQIIFVLFKDANCLIRNLKHCCSPRSVLRTTSRSSFELRKNKFRSPRDATATSFKRLSKIKHPRKRFQNFRHTWSRDLLIVLPMREPLIFLVIIWLVPRAGKMNQIARCDWLPERARWSHLARSGLPAVSRKQNFPKSHIINPLLTKFVRSRWLDIGLVLFLRVNGPRLRLDP